ncbi:MAG: AbrB/MazE/SpoVT family DNA-binding domain-containing protein [Deltaproteobacteria bacterium]|nr:AbrB/MazE/SpoVT family DNA-binding domain-containing protein [Deltaproteobacteria bacterium]
MEAKLDRFGRVLIPKRVRDHLGLSPGTVLEISERGDAVLLRPLREEGTLVEQDGLLVFRGRATGDLDEAVARTRAARLEDLTASGGR